MCNKDKENEDSILDNLVIASPCSVPWDAMKGDNRKRLCSGCSNFVHNISDMTKSEAEDFLAENGTSECMIFYRRQDGTIMTDDCPVALRKLRDSYRWTVRTAAAVFSFLLSLPAAWSQQASEAPADSANQQTNKAPAKPMRMNRFGMLVGPDWKEPTPPPGFHYQGNPAGGGMILVPNSKAVKGEPSILPPGQAIAPVPVPAANNSSTKTNSKSNCDDPVMVIKKMAKDQQLKHEVAGKPMMTHPVMPGAAPFEPTPPKNRPLLNTKAYESYKKGEEAEKNGNKSMAEFHYEKALEAFDSQAAGDSGFRVQIDRALKRVQAKN